MDLFLITQVNNNGTVRFQKGIINDATNIFRINHSSTKTYQHLKYIIYYLSRTLIIKASAVYHVALKQPSGRSLVVNHRTSDVQVTPDKTVTLVLVSVELSTSISGSHTAKYIVNAYVSLIHVYLC